MKTAVVLFNLGGPDSPKAVRPFLFNLFNDPAIIGAPAPLRWILATYLSRRRAPVAREIYARLGGGSPLLENTRAQARALEEELGDLDEARVFIAMRYWHPLSDETARAVAVYGPDEVVLLPLYPQYSTTTTASSLSDWRRAAGECGLSVPTRALCCYPTEPSFVAAHVEPIRKTWEEAGGEGKARVLFSAHGLPKRVVERGDPYPWQVERTVSAVVAAVARAVGGDKLDWVLCYQSRVGPLEWIGPSTDAEIARAGADGVALVVVPIAFVSEHSETLVELDMEYRALAEKAGVPVYLRVPTLGVDPGFIKALGDLTRRARSGPGLCSQEDGRLCPTAHERCPLTPASGD